MPVGSGTALGWGALLGYGLETTWGTAVTATSFMEFRSESLKKTIDEEKLESIGGGRSVIRRVQKNVNVEGSLAFDLHPVDGIHFLKQALMGTVTSATSGAAGSLAFVHTFTTGDLSTVTQKGVTFEVKPWSETTTAWIYNGCRVQSYKISANINEPVKCEIEWVGRDATTGTFATTTATFSPVRPFLFQDGTFGYGDSGGNVTTEQIVSFELTIENNLQSDEKSRSLGTTLLTALPPGRRNVMLSISQRFDTTTAWSRFLSNSQGAIRLSFNTGATIGSTAGNTTYAMHLDLPKVYYNSAVPEIGDSGILTHEVEVSAIGDTVTSSNRDIVVTLYNSGSSY